MALGKIGAVAAGLGILAAIGLIIKKGTMGVTDIYRGASTQTANFIALLENFYPKAYWDFKQWSVGYGSGYNYDLKTPVTKDTVVDKATAKRWLLAEAYRNAETINNYVKVPLTTNQFVALLAFVYNVGDQAFKSSTLLKKINSKSPKQDIKNAWAAWKMAGGQVNQGLINRRAKEINMFFS